MSDQKKQIEELTLLLLFLTSWKESTTPSLRPKPLKEGDEYVLRTWKGYDHGALDSLDEQGYISNRKGKTPLIIRESGVAYAQELMKKYGISDKVQ